MKDTDRFYLGVDEPNRSCLMALRNIILDQDIHVEEYIKWSLPCFCYKKRMFCFLSIDSKINQPYLLIVEGKRLNHPMLEAKGRARMRSITFDPDEDLPVEAVVEILNSALDLYRNGTIKVKS